MRKEIYMGHGLYKQVEVKEKAWSEKDLDLKSGEKVEWRIVELEGGGYIRRPFKIQTESQKITADNQSKVQKFQTEVGNYSAILQKDSTDYQWLQSQYVQLKTDYQQGLQFLISGGLPPPQQERGR